MLDHKVSEVSLKNGTKGLLVHIDSSTVMTFDFCFKAGYSNAPKDKFDLPHVLEHVLLGANKKYPKAKLFNAEIEKNGAYTNGTTDQNNIHYLAESADFEWQRVLDLMLTSLVSPLFLEEEFKAELGNVSEELSSNLNSYYRVLGTNLAQEMGLETESYSNRIKLLKNIKINDIKKYYKKTHTAQNLQFIIAGNVKWRKKKIVNILNSYIDLLPQGRAMEIPDNKAFSLKKPLLIKRKEAEKIYFYIDIYHSQRMNEDEICQMFIVNNMLTGTLHSNLLGEAREKGLLYSMGSGVTRGKNWSDWWFGADVTSHNIQEVFDIMVEQIKKIANGDIKKSDVEAAIALETGRFQRSYQQVSDISNFYSSEYFFDGTIDNYKHVDTLLKGVNIKKITDTTNKILDKNCWGIGILGRVGDVDPKLLHDKFATIFDSNSHLETSPKSNKSV